VKYWTLACKLKRMQQGQNPNKYNTRYTAVLVTGIVLNVISGVVSSLEYPNLSPTAENVIRIATAIFMLPLLLSCLFLFDAFRMFRNNKNSDKVINNVQVGVLSLAFGSYAIGYLVETLEGLILGPTSSIPS
jgi:hypothetical protein